MATVSRPATENVGDRVITLDIGPRGLDGYLALVGDRPNPRIVYHQGSLTLVSPSQKHERGAKRLDRIVATICEELDIAYRATGSTLFRQSDADHGIEADETYYIEHERDVRDVEDDIDLDVDPPPDLAIEVVVTHSPTKALTICQEMGVPEIWLFWAKPGRVEFLHLDPQAGYVSATTSRAFPFLTPDDVCSWVLSSVDEPDNRWERRLRAWVRDVLGPRREAAGNP